MDYQLIDFDTHYYEPLDAYTRHLDPKIRKQRRGVEMVTTGGRTYASIGGRLSNFVPNVTFNPVAGPGSLEAYFRGEADGGRARELADVVPLDPSYQERVPRLAVMAEQGVEECVLLATFAYGIEEALCGDVEAMHATMEAFNRWLHEEFGFTGPTIAAPMIPMSDVERACAELRWALSEGARVIALTPGPVRLAGGDRCSPAHPRFDPFWQIVEGAGVTVAYHAADAGYFRYFKDYGDPADFNPFSSAMKLGSLWAIDRPMQDMVAVLVMQKLFDRFPNLRIVSVEQGIDWLPVVLDRLTKQYKRRPWIFAEPPEETLRRHLWVCPFWEDDVTALIDVVGVDHVVFG
nr:amidohydrolase [Actinomycetota bacterium]